MPLETRVKQFKEMLREKDVRKLGLLLEMRCIDVCYSKSLGISIQYLGERAAQNCF